MVAVAMLLMLPLSLMQGARENPVMAARLGRCFATASTIIRHRNASNDPALHFDGESYHRV